MNGTIWDAVDEIQVFTYFALGATSLSIHCYLMFLNSAISDYQSEKPVEEKSPLDVLLKKTMDMEFYIFFAYGVLHIISLFTPELSQNALIQISDLI